MKFKDVANLYLPFLAICDEKSYMVNGYSQSEDMFRIDTSETDFDWWNTDNFKPVLKRLSDLNNQDLCFLLKEKFKYDFLEKFRVENGDSVEPMAIYFKGFKKINDRITETPCTQYISSLTPFQFKFLLNIGVDLFGLIESGEAIHISDLTA